jgi:hypothetical protein
MVGVALLLSLAGCGHDTPAEVHQKQEAAADRGRAKFSEELAQKNLTWYVTAGGNFTGFDRNTGLPEQLVTSTGTVEPYSADFIRGHNDAILNYIASNGPVPGSFKPWENQLYHQAIYFDMHRDQRPQQLRVGGAPARSDDGQYTLLLQPSGATGNQITNSAFQLSVLTAAGEHATGPPAGISEPAAEVLFGPAGSDLAFTRWPSAGQPIYAALDLRDGRWLVVQSGQQ